MKQKRERIYRLDGMELKVPLYYHAKIGKALAGLPDLEETPVYTAAGHLCVGAVQDACSHGENAASPREPCMDCGSCRHYWVELAGDLIGVCTHPKNRRT